MYFTDEPAHITMLRDTLRRFLAAELPPEKARQCDRDKTFDRQSFRRLAELGVCGLTIAPEYGGQGRDLVAAVAVIEELARHGPALAAPFIHSAFYGGVNISESGSEAQKRELLPQLARGEITFAYGLSEPDVGGDLASVSTRARIEGDRVVIDGCKRWMTGARFADWYYCLVRSDADAPRYRNLSLVLVPASAPGLTVQDIEHSGLRYAETCDVYFDGVSVPLQHIVGGPEGWNQGWKKLAGPSLDVEKLEITACALGFATGAVELAWRYAQERTQFGKPICAHQSVRHDLVDVRTQLQACRHMLYHAAWLAHEGRPCSVETSMAKLFVGDTAVQIVLKCQQVMGAYGTAQDYDMERYVRDLLVMPIVGGSSKMQKNNIAARLKLTA